MLCKNCLKEMFIKHIIELDDGRTRREYTCATCPYRCHTIDEGILVELPLPWSTKKAGKPSAKKRAFERILNKQRGK